MKKKNIGKTLLAMIVSILLAIVFWAGSPGFADPGKKWVPIIDAEPSPGGEPELRILESNENRLDIEMVTRGFFTSEREENRQRYNVVNIGRYHGDLNPGYPNLPTVRQYVYIPRGKTARIHVTPGSAVVFDNYLIYPVQKPQFDTKDAVDPGFFIDDAVYRSDRVFPSQLAFIEKIQDIRGHQVALLHICPFRYNPGRRVLTAYPGIEVQVTFDGQAETIDPRLYSPIFDNFIKGFVLNPDAFSQYGGDQADSSEEGAEFLIITAPGFLTPANDLHDHKENLGLSTVVKTTNDTGTGKDDIKNYIQNAYDTWSPAPSYVLLLGDVETIPTTYETTTSRGTDLYYSTVSGTDYEPDIFLGRISVDTLSEAQTVVQKIINYESNPPVLASFYANTVGAAYFQDYADNDGYEDRRFVRTAEEVRDFLLTKGYSVERIYCRTQNGIDPTHYNNGYYGSGEPLPEELLISNGFAWDGAAADISSAVNSGIFLLLHRDHGMDRNDGYAHTGWGDPYFVETHVDALTNGELLPVVLSINCQTGWFDGETDQNTSLSYESFCELFLRKSGAGAVGVIGATRNSYSGYNDFLAEGFIDCVWPDFLTSVPNNSGASSRLGPMLNHGKIAMDILWGDPWDLRQVEYELFHVHGDPTLRMWTQQAGTQGTHTVRVQSKPALGVPITVSQSDINGNSNGDTNFTRTYLYGTNVTLTAPASYNGSDFIKWIVDGADVGDQDIQLTMDSYHLVTAVYSTTYTLTVNSSPVTGIPITVSPNDNNGNGNGNTNFTRYYDSGMQVTLTAPATCSGRDFVRWLIDGTPDQNRTIQVTMDDDHTVVAEFSILPGDEMILLIDLDANNNSSIEMKAAIEANGYVTETFTTVPAEINSALYPAVFVSLGIYPYNHVLTSQESQALEAYLDNGGNLYMEGGDTWAYDPLTPVHAYFGIEGVDDGWGDTLDIDGITGTFTQGINFTYEGENNYMDHLDTAVGAADAFIMWDNQGPYYHNGVARDTGLYKTIGVSFEFGGIPTDQQNLIMEKYLNFFLSEPSITVLSPNGGEKCNLGTARNITWECRGVSGDLKIYLWKDGALKGTIAKNLDPASGAYLWNVGQYEGGTAAPGTGYTIKIKEMGVHLSDFSDAPFTICSLTVTSPNGGENWKSGSAQNITWNCREITGNLKIYLWKNGALKGTIAKNLDPAAGSYPWITGQYEDGEASVGPGYTIKIKEMGVSLSDFSDAPFNITGITVTAPNGGENWQIGSTENITWNTQGVSGNLKIYLYKDGALVGTIAKNLDPAAGYYAWTVGQYEGGTASAGTGYTIKIKEMGVTVGDFSDNPFTLSN